MRTSSCAPLALCLALAACSGGQGTSAQAPSDEPPCADAFQALAEGQDQPPSVRAERIRGLFPRCDDALEAPLRELAKGWHESGAQTVDPERLAGARILYQLYHERFADADEHPRTRYHQAQLLWQLAETAQESEAAHDLWVQAGRIFGEVAETGALGAERTKESAHLSVRSYSNAMGVAGRIDHPIPESAEAGGPLPLPDDVQEMIEAVRRYARHTEDPNDPELVTMKFLEGSTMAVYRHYPKAIPLLDDIVAHHRDHPVAEFALYGLLDAHLALGQLDRATKIIDDVLADQAFLADKQNLAGHLLVMRRKFRSLRAQTLEVEGEFAECARLYTALADDPHPAVPADQSLYKAGVCYEEAGDTKAAIDAYQRLEKRYPESTFVSMAAERRARLGKPTKPQGRKARPRKPSP